ncbi:MAG: PEP-CTERM sorting domain-containing protein [Planctomycetales bacterium]|nr:PEP-CTERM sorting domain-containing protein [Planctomycetales bacterium]
MKMRLTCTALVLVVCAGQTAFAALMDITRPGDAIELISGFNQNDGNDGDPPGAEGVEHAIDDIGQKYLNFKDLSSGFSVTPSANVLGEPVTGIRFYAANDAEPRDPASYQLFGSNDSIGGPWEAISSGAVMLPSARNPGGNAVMIPPSGNLGASYYEVLFDNADTYDHYQVLFPTLKDAEAANSMQIAEVELLAEVPEPGTFGLIALGLMGIMGIARRK